MVSDLNRLLNTSKNVHRELRTIKNNGCIHYTYLYFQLLFTFLHKIEKAGDNLLCPICRYSFFEFWDVHGLVEDFRIINKLKTLIIIHTRVQQSNALWINDGSYSLHPNLNVCRQNFLKTIILSLSRSNSCGNWWYAASKRTKHLVNSYFWWFFFTLLNKYLTLS